MNVSNFTEKSKEAITSASNIATSNRNAEISDFHMLLAFLGNKESIVVGLLKKMEVNIESLKSVVQSEIQKFPKVTGNVSLRFSPEVEKSLDEAEKQARAMKDEYISVEHLMLGIIEKASEELKRLVSTKQDGHYFIGKNVDENGIIDILDYFIK